MTTLIGYKVSIVNIQMLVPLIRSGRKHKEISQ
jgi:hypothetical protein